MRLVIERNKNGYCFFIPLNLDEEFKEDEYYILCCEYLGCKLRLVKDFSRPHNMVFLGVPKKVYRVNIPPVLVEKYGITPKTEINLLKVIEKR